MERVKSLVYLDIFWVEECRCVLLQWKGGALNRDLHAGMNAALDELRARGAGAQLIGDTTHIGPLTDEEQNWINTDWHPRFLATGTHYLAAVLPASVVAKMNLSSTLQKYEGTNLTVFSCASQKEAIDWMKSVNK